MDVPPALAGVVEALDATQWAFEVLDERWHRVWASKEMRLILRLDEDADVGIGEHLLEGRDIPPFDTIDDESARAWFLQHAPFVMWDTGATNDDLRALASERLAPLADRVVAVQPPPRWSFALRIGDLGEVHGLGSRVLDEQGALLGTVFLYGSALPASILAFLSRGDLAHFRRMAELVTPGRRLAGVLFADVEGSTDRSRRLPTARYFELIRALAIAIDDVILEQGGVVGKHAGDGVSAFFIADQIGSPSRAARATVQAARGIMAAAARQEGGWRVKLGIHWGSTLYVGQFATSGRLEVTALGDEVNECARLQEAAHGGQLLTSKALLERLEPADAAALGIDPVRMTYQLVRELPDVGAKALRDAGALPVAVLEA